MNSIRWQKRVDPDDYDVARSYLSLLLDSKRAEKATDRLQRAKICTRRASDVLRACRREPLPASDPSVKRVLQEIKDGKELKPVLVVSFDVGGDIVDGYDRVSTAYFKNPSSCVRVVIAHIPDLERSDG